jgi:phosphoribosylamine--glycine ligase
LEKADITWKSGAAACVVMASGGYPGTYNVGVEINGLDDSGEIVGATVYHAGTKYDGQFRTSGGRVLGVTATANTLESALESAYHAVERISFDKAHYRMDIGRR